MRAVFVVVGKCLCWCGHRCASHSLVIVASHASEDSWPAAGLRSKRLGCPLGLVRPDQARAGQ